MSYDNTNTGAIFKNEKKEGAQPDYRGTINVDGIEKEIAMWVKDSKTGKKFFSVKISEPYKKTDTPTTVNQLEQEDDLPF